MGTFRRILLLAVFVVITTTSLFSQSKTEITIPGIPFKLHWKVEPVSFRVEASMLVMEAGEKTDMFRDPNVTYNTDNAPKLLFKPDGDFILVASIQHDFKEKWDGGAIVLIADSLNWVKFCFEKDYTGAKRVVSVVTKNISDDCNSVAIEGNKVFYKLAKAGPVITLYYSVNNKDWLLVRHFQIDKTNNLLVGFLAQSPAGKGCSVRFGDIHYEHKKITDPYKGE